jgi:short-subunit dehydrogenase
MWFRANHPDDVLTMPRWGFFRERQAEAVEPRSPSIRTALITGASSGIGCELAKILAAQRHNLVLVARDHTRLLGLSAELESRHGITVTAITCDLASPSAPAELLAELRQRSLVIDVLVNNAGFALGGMFAETETAETVSLLHVNVVALTHLTRLLLPGMVARQSGRVLNVASIAGFYPGPLTACYNASKAFVISFSLAISNELKGTGVTVTALCPGPTRTGFAQRAGLCGTKAFRDNVMDAAAVAHAGYAAMMAGKPLAVTGLRNKLRMIPIPLVPSRMLAHFSRKYHEV